jgi:hypothetical protein
MYATKATLRAARIKAVWRAERHIREAFGNFLRRQLRSVAAELRQGEAADIDTIFDASEWHKRLIRAMRPPIGRAMVTGGLSELALLRRRLGSRARAGRKSTASELLEELGLDLPGGADGLGFALEVPEWLIAKIGTELDETFAADFWADPATGVNATTRDAIKAVLDDGLSEGRSVRDMARAIQDMGEGDYNRWRATAVARTEAGRALNAGHEMSIQGTADETGLAMGKTWLSVLGSTTRPSHAALDGVTVPTDGLFALGGVEVPYPGHRDLPPEESINCQCTLTSAILDVAGE